MKLFFFACGRASSFPPRDSAISLLFSTLHQVGSIRRRSIMRGRRRLELQPLTLELIFQANNDIFGSVLSLQFSPVWTRPSLSLSFSLAIERVELHQFTKLPDHRHTKGHTPSRVGRQLLLGAVSDFNQQPNSRAKGSFKLTNWRQIVDEAKGHRRRRSGA